MAEILTEKEKIWLTKRTKTQKFFLGLAILCFVCSIFYLLVYSISYKTNIFLAVQAGYAFVIAFLTGCFLMGMRSEANRFLKIINKLH